MTKRKYYSLILIILLISVMALAQESTTVNGILANYTELNTSRIFRIYDTSLNEILLSEDGLYLSHVNGGINEIKISSTNTQFSQQIDMQGNDIINCGNCDTPDNLKVNKSGAENITGRINISTSGYWSTSTVQDINGVISFMHNGTFLGKILPTGAQHWNVSNAVYINYGGATDSWGGIIFRNNTLGQRSDMRHNLSDGSLRFYVSNTTSVPTDYITMTNDQNLTITKLAGAGNAYACLDSTGKIYRGTPTC